MPRVSVIMSVYNGEDYISECIESILNQTYRDFEFIIYDDCSSDQSEYIIKNYSSDFRIKFFKNDTNLGLTKTLNKMIDISNGEFIARMDADDVAHSRWLEKLVDYMSINSEVGVCGVNSVIIGNDNKPSRPRTIFSHEELKAMMLFQNAMPHASTMIRSDLLNLNSIRYNEYFRIIQDYELWQRLIRLTKFHVLKDDLFIHRYIPSSVTATSCKIKNYRENYLSRIYEKALEDFGLIIRQKDIQSHLRLTNNSINHSQEMLHCIEDWLIRILEKNNKIAYFNKDIFDDLVHTFWISFCTRSTSLGVEALSKCVKSPLYKVQSKNSNMMLKFVVKSLIRYRADSSGRYI